MRSRLIAIGAFVALVCGLGAVWAKTAKPPTIDDVAKTWVGYADDELIFVRLELRTDGAGCCATAYNPQTILYGSGVHTYWVRRWQLEGNRLSFQVTATSTNSESIYLNGRLSAYTMDLEIGGTKGSWSRKLVLRPESNLLIPNRDTKEAIKRISQSAPRELTR